MYTFFVLGFGCLLAAGNPKQGAPKAEKANIQGIWRIERLEDNGEEQKNVQADLAIESDRLGVRFLLAGLPRATVFTYVVDASKKPNWIDLTYADGDQKGKSRQGIYQLDRDSLMLCLANLGGKRPAQFQSPQGSKQTLIVLKRDKP
jgi:uncharacterized protein (TIGR03067 family)